MSDKYLDPPDTLADAMRMQLGMSMMAELVERKSAENGDLDRFVMIDEDAREYDEKKINTAVELGVLGEKQDGAVIYSRLDEVDVTFADVTDEDGNWEFES